MQYTLIESKDNKQFKLLKKLDKKKYRDDLSLYLLEGDKFLNESIKYNSIFIDQSKFEQISKKYVLPNDNVYILSTNLFNEISTQVNSQGVIFLIQKEKSNISDINEDVVILDNVQDPGNIGTIIRTLVALDYKNLILTNNCCDIYNSKVLRSSMGAFIHLNIVYESKENILDFLKNNKYNILSTCLSNDSIIYTKAKLESKNAYIFGSEGNGISDEFIENSNQKLIIPISKNVDSLNVGIALGVILYKMKEIGDNL